jgi:hypothetical protein
MGNDGSDSFQVRPIRPLKLDPSLYVFIGVPSAPSTVRARDTGFKRARDLPGCPRRGWPQEGPPARRPLAEPSLWPQLWIAPRILNRPHSITATVEIQDGAEGVLVAQGGSSGGYALYVKDRKLHYAYNYLGVERFQ